EHRVLADEADARALGSGAVDVLVGVHQHPVGTAEAPPERVEALAELSVVVTPCIAREARFARPGRPARLVVAERSRDDGPRAVEERLRVARDLRPGHREA